MKNFFSSVKRAFVGEEKADVDEMENEYVEIDTEAAAKEDRSKVIVRPFAIDDFSDVKQILDALRRKHDSTRKHPSFERQRSCRTQACN